MCIEKPLVDNPVRLVVVNPLDILAFATTEDERVTYASLAIRMVESASKMRTNRAIERERVKLSREIGAIAALERSMDETEQRNRTAYRSQADREWNGSQASDTFYGNYINEASIPATKPKRISKPDLSDYPGEQAAWGDGDD